MKHLLLILVLAFFSGPLFADAIDDAKATLDLLSAYGPNAKTLTPAQMLSIANRYNQANGFSNPWDEVANPAEYAAWPTNTERATFLLQRLGGEIRSDIGRVAGQEHDGTSAASRAAAVQQAEDEL
jgi:hypothetical protein